MMYKHVDSIEKSSHLGWQRVRAARTVVDMKVVTMEVADLDPPVESIALDSNADPVLVDYPTAVRVTNSFGANKFALLTFPADLVLKESDALHPFVVRSHCMIDDYLDATYTVSRAEELLRALGGKLTLRATFMASGSFVIIPGFAFMDESSMAVAMGTDAVRA